MGPWPPPTTRSSTWRDSKAPPLEWPFLSPTPYQLQVTLGGPAHLSSLLGSPPHPLGLSVTFSPHGACPAPASISALTHLADSEHLKSGPHLNPSPSYCLWAKSMGSSPGASSLQLPSSQGLTSPRTHSEASLSLSLNKAGLLVRLKAPLHSHLSWEECPIPGSRFLPCSKASLEASVQLAKPSQLDLHTLLSQP